MKRIVGCTLIAVLVATVVYGAAYKEGKEVLDKDCKVDVLKVQWGLGEGGMDRLIGTVRLFVAPTDDLYRDITLSFDVFSKKAVTNDAPARDAKGQTRAPKTEKVDTTVVVFNFHKYGYKATRQYAEGEFCVDFARKPDANRLQLANVEFMGNPVVYRMSFNMNGSLLKTLFRLPEPKVTVTKQ